jgi:hypothetical protein
VFDTRIFDISHCDKYKGIHSIHDMVAIEDGMFLIAAGGGLLKPAKDKTLNHYFKDLHVRSICHVSASSYLLSMLSVSGTPSKKYPTLLLWDASTEQSLFSISDSSSLVF